jgi:uncharacterized membrane protein
VGGRKGVRSLIALVLTIASLALIFIPLVSKGFSPVWAAILVCFVSTLITLLIVCGWTGKSASALVGILFGVLCSGIIVLIMQKVMDLTGIVDNEALRLSQTPQYENLNMNGLMFAAILIGFIGAAMDVGVSIASSLEELSKHSGVKGLDLVRSGISIGRDIMGTMTNTLVLAYVGGALHLVLLLAADLSQPGYILSWELLATEILRALAGSTGLVLIIPATSIVSALIYRKGTTETNPFS